MNQKILFIIYWLIILIIFETTALYLLKKNSIYKTNNYLLYSCLIYGIIIPLILLKTLEYEGIGMINFFWNIFSTIGGFLIGIYLFNETINHKQVIGILLSFIGLYIVIFNKTDISYK